MNVVVYGDAPNRSLVEWAELIKGDLLKDDAITQVDVEQRRGFELKIEIPRSALQQYSLTMDQISQIIQQSTLDMPGGKIETSVETCWCAPKSDDTARVSMQGSPC